MSACPRCGFMYAWDGTTCAHCGAPSAPAPSERDKDEWVERRILFKVGQHGLPRGRTFQFQDLCHELQLEIRAAAGSSLRGRPVLALVDSPSRWTLLTTREVICL